MNYKNKGESMLGEDPDFVLDTVLKLVWNYYQWS